MTTSPPDDSGLPAFEEGPESSHALVPRHLDFYGDDLLATQYQKQIWVHIARMVQCLGLSLSDQIEHIQNHGVLTKGMRTFPIQTTRGARPAQFLRLGLVPLYLATIQVQSVRKDLRLKLLKYQEEAADVLYAAFLSEFGVIEPGRTLQEHGQTSAEQSYQQAQVLVNLARQQLSIERELGNVREEVTGQHEVLAIHEERLGQLELTLGTSDKITEAQATEIKEAIKAIGTLKGEQSNNKATVKPTIQAVWGRFYREFGVRVYANLPRTKFDQAMQFLREVAQEFGVELDKGGK